MSTNIHRDIEQLRELLRRKKKYGEYQTTFAERNSFSKTDPDATFMRMKEDHMHIAQLQPGAGGRAARPGVHNKGVDANN